MRTSVQPLIALLHAVTPLRRWRCRIACALTVALAMIALPALAADVPSARLLEQERDAKAFREWVMQASTRNDASALQSDHGMALLRRVADAAYLLDTVDYRREDVGGFLSVCAHVMGSMDAIWKFGLGPTATGAEAALILPGAVRANASRFEPQVIVLMPLYLRCPTVMTAALYHAYNALQPDGIRPEHRNDLLQKRHLLARGYLGSVQMITSPGVSPSVKEVVLDTLVESADRQAALLSLFDRKAIGNLLRDRAGKVDPVYRERLERTAVAFDDPECVGLCTY